VATHATARVCAMCHSELLADAQFCTRCGAKAPYNLCLACSQPLSVGATFCEWCGTRRPPLYCGSGMTALESVTLALESVLCMLDPNHAFRASTECLTQHPAAPYAAVASLVSMASESRLGNYSEAHSSLISARGFYADHLNLSVDQRTRFVESGCLIDDLVEIGNRDVQLNPWLYFLLGHAYGPVEPRGYLGDSEADRLNAAGSRWADFFTDRREEALRTLSYLYLIGGRVSDACRYLGKLILIARKYESLAPTRIEVVWPKVSIGDCCWALGEKLKAAQNWQRARSAILCIEPETNEWDRLGFSWIDTAKARLKEHAIPIPALETSQKSSEHLAKAVQALLDAEKFEAEDVDLAELAALVKRSSSQYTELLRCASQELVAIDQLDAFAWARVHINGSKYWFSYDQVRSLLLQKIGLLHLSNDKLPLAIASYKQAMEIWPTLSVYGLIGELQAACGLNSDARITYRECICRAEEFAVAESSQNRESILTEIRVALGHLRA
jgi:tetratricopeptide (TPR) repeat protein